MKTRILFLIAFLGAFTSFSQKEVGLLSDIKKVTVFFQGAQLEHYKSTELKAGKQEIVFKNLLILSIRIQFK